MRILKIIGVILLILIAAYLVACLMGPKRVDASRSTLINAPRALVYNTVADLTTWKEWSAWTQDDTTMTITMGETTRGKGASYSWTDPSGGGTLEIIEAEPYSKLKSQIGFGSFPGYSNGTWIFADSGEQTFVTWSMTNDTDIPFFARGVLYTLNSDIGKDFEKGLSNLKKLTEEKAMPPYSYRNFEIKVEEVGARNYLAHRKTISMAETEMQAFFGTQYGHLMGQLLKAGVEMDGAPSALYYSWDEKAGMTDVAAAIPVKSEVAVMKHDTLISLPASRAAILDYYGSYDNLEEAHYAIDDLFVDFGYELQLPVVEEYITDPMAEPDTSRWLTRIVYRIK